MNTHTFQLIAPKIHKAKLTEIQKEADKSIIGVGDSNSLYQNLILLTKNYFGYRKLVQHCKVDLIDT